MRGVVEAMEEINESPPSWVLYGKLFSPYLKFKTLKSYTELPIHV